ncbi:MAG: GspH/FimT family pseudopilin [Deltaproteobacteria bacterium]|nr:GspH/FimT family pseudopilin [Deltaproteobacteria bacterium]
MRGLKGSPCSGSARGALGLTGIELLICLVILSVLAVIAVPGFLKWLPNYRLKGAVRDLYSNLQLAKAGAIRDRGERVVLFRASSHSYELWSWGGNGAWDGFSEPNDTLLKSVSLPSYGSGLSYGPGSATRKVGENKPIGDAVSFLSDRVVFNSRGMTTGTLGGYAYIQNERMACFAVGTWSSGIVVLRKWNGTTWE